MTGEKLADSRIEYLYPNPKIEGLRELLADKTPDDKTIIWACFRADIAYIETALAADGIDYVSFHGGTSDEDRIEAERRFNFDPACKVFVGNAAAGGTGLNLLGYPPGAPEGYTTNCNHVIYYSQNWSQTARTQSEDRAHRRGTRQTVRVTDLVVPESIDEEIRLRVMRKKLHALEVSDIREILRTCMKGLNNV
jgi:SNF2 family DNA or RNA helicase